VIRSRLVVALAAIALVPAALVAQLPIMPGPPGPPVDPAARFEAATVKAVEADNTGMRMMIQPGRFEASGVPLRMLLRQALRVQDYQMSGVPSWADSERFAVLAKAPDGAPPNATMVMLLNLLKDRFNLAMHVEQRELPVFTLVVARNDGRLGPSLKPSSPECQELIKSRSGGPGRAAGPGGPGPGGPGPGGPGAGASVGRGAGPPPGGPGGLPPFDMNNIGCGTMRSGPGIFAVSGQPISVFVQMLAQSTGRPVVDKTGLTGPYDITMKYMPEAGMAGMPGGALPPGVNLAIDPDAPNLFTAVQEQLGLKLENARGPVDVTVIDRVERPTVD
jgi:uncharacterized protein (TIGR03435 family)